MIPKVTDYEVYKTYLGISRHFTTESYDYQKYCGKVRCSLQSFYKNKQRFWFEKLSRKYDDNEIKELFVSNYALSEDNSKIWIGNLVREGETLYSQWKKNQQSMSYLFRQECDTLFGDNKIDDVFDCSKGHPLLLKKHLSKEVSLETLIIIDRILNYKSRFDKSLSDPVWESVSMKMRKYGPFLNIDVFKYKKILKEVVVG
tara:strand:+ start:547 stop:1149 length:603 start_codon:yes stop_codon:yes gene_type:complete